MVPCPKSTALFGFFAQWFADGFLRTDPSDSRRNTSNHEIDLCQIYGLSDKDTEILRCKRKERAGELKSQTINGKSILRTSCRMASALPASFAAFPTLMSAPVDFSFPNLTRKSPRQD
jgi:hypothetical protein